jgi:hypothetical protein
MAIQTSAGTTLKMATALPTAPYTLTTFQAVTPLIAVGEITDLGEFGKEYNTVDHVALGNRQKRKFKGSFDNGSLNLQMGRDLTDVGQVALRAALLSDNSYTFCVTFQDLSKNFFTGKVMSYKTSVGSVDQITGANTVIAIDSEIFESAT